MNPVAAPARHLELVDVIGDSSHARWLYTTGTVYLVVFFSPWVGGYVAYRSTITGEDTGIPIVNGEGRTRAEVLDRLEYMLAAGEL